MAPAQTWSKTERVTVKAAPTGSGPNVQLGSRGPTSCGAKIPAWPGRSLKRLSAKRSAAFTGLNQNPFARTPPLRLAGVCLGPCAVASVEMDPEEACAHGRDLGVFGVDRPDVGGRLVVRVRPVGPVPLDPDQGEQALRVPALVGIEVLGRPASRAKREIGHHDPLASANRRLTESVDVALLEQKEDRLREGSRPQHRVLVCGEELEQAVPVDRAVGDDLGLPHPGPADGHVEVHAHQWSPNAERARGQLDYRPRPSRFVTTSEKFAPMMEEMGGRNGGVYKDENDPSLVSTISEWESHDQMHEAIEKYDDQFNEEAGTADLRWTTHIWHRRGSA